jgi:hypothetical protein
MTRGRSGSGKGSVGSGSYDQNGSSYPGYCLSCVKLVCLSLFEF